MTEQPPRPANRSEFLEWYDRSWLRLESFISELDAEQLVVPADAAGWNVRDHLAHICAWEHTMLAFLDGQHQWEGVGLTEEQWKSGNIDTINELIRAMTINVNPSEVIEMLKESNAALLAKVESTADDILEMPAKDFHPDFAGSPEALTVIGVVHGDAGEHFDEHQPWIEKIVKN